MYLWRKVLLFSFHLLRQRHDISVILFIVHGHALWRGRMSEFGPIRNHYHVHLVDHSARAGCSTFCCATPCWREPTSSKQLSTVAAFCWFSVWSLSCRCRVKFSTQSSLAEIWVIYIFGWLDLLQILRILAAFSLCGPLLIVCCSDLGLLCRVLRASMSNLLIDIRYILCYFLSVFEALLLVLVYSECPGQLVDNLSHNIRQMQLPTI